MVRQNRADTLIERLGEYQLGTELALVVSKSGDNTVVFDLCRGGEVLISEDTRSSLFQRWYFLWHTPGNELWFHSSDNGGKLWRDRDGVCEPLEIVEELKRMPALYFDNLPSGLQERWKGRQVQDDPLRLGEWNFDSASE